MRVLCFKTVYERTQEGREDSNYCFVQAAEANALDARYAENGEHAKSRRESRLEKGKR
jgi:hypothetical protein